MGKASTMNDQPIDELMTRYLQGNCSADEKVRFEAWLAASVENRQQFYEARLVWHAARIEHFASPGQLNKALDRFANNREQSRRSQPIYIKMARYAAIAAAVVVVAWLLFMLNSKQDSTSELVTASVAQTDSSQLVVLHDGTRVWLNNNSSITYPKTFGKGERSVTLEGEAFFDVTHDAAHPFIINTSTISIKVLGTTFNVQAYRGETGTEAVLVSGSIAIADGLGQNLATIQPGQMARFEKKDRRLTVSAINPDHYTNWRTGEITLTAANLKTIARKLTELYQVTIALDPALPDTTSYNFIFSKRKPAKEVLNMLCFIAPVQYQIKGNNVLITSK